MKAGLNSTTFVTTLTRANVRNGGAIVDTNGFDVTIDEELLHSNIGGDNATDGGLTKMSAGILTLTGANTYTGNTTISGGTLKLAPAATIATTPLIDVAAGSTFDVSAVSYSLLNGQKLQGKGTVTGGVLMASGSQLAPGQSVGTLTFDSGILNLNGIGTGALLFELGTTAASDSVLLTGATLDIGTLDFNEFSFTTLGGFGPGTYTLFDSTNSIVGSIGTATGTVGIYDAALSIDGTNNNLLLTVTAIPEPGTWAMMILGGAGLCLLRRKRSALSETI